MDEDKNIYNPESGEDSKVDNNMNDYDSKDDDDEKRRNKRRSKNDNDGRNHRCPTCGKSYLSYPALYTHIKQKHNANGSSGRGRGRPKKDTGEPNPEKLKFNPLDVSYFSHEERRGQVIDLIAPIEEAFMGIYGTEFSDRNSIKKLPNCDHYSAHPFLKRILDYKLHQVKPLDTDNAKCDEVFCEYLIKMAEFTNEKYFSKLIKYVTLFRECVNIINREKNKTESRDYTEITNAEDVPDISNEFITEFLDPDTNQFDFSKEEAIDLTQNFCHWLYENNFTCSKLSLISNY